MDASTFAGATAVTPLGAGRWAGEVADGWDIAGNANGGYLLGIVARAVQAEVGRDPVTTTAHYLAPGKPGPVQVAVEVVRSGRRFTTALARLEAADGKPLLQVLTTCGEVGAAGAPLLADGAPPDLPPPDECLVRAGGTGTDPAMGFASRVESRLHPDDAGFTRGEPTGRALVRGWFRLRGEEPMDPVALLLACDAFPPAVFNAALPTAWVPTVELTCHVRAVPAPGWLRCAFRTRFVGDGLLDEEAELWDERGHLVAQSRQLALLPRPS